MLSWNEFRHLSCPICCELTDTSLASDKDPLERGLVDDVLEGGVEGLEIFNVGHGVCWLVAGGVGRE